MSPEERREGHWPGAGRSPMDASMAVAGQESGELPAGATNITVLNNTFKILKIVLPCTV